ncbi:hypothetical protein OC845_004057 [Tilletia horrida]|nr:hypothetical protein OC845_004057 [Tilletia horrida]
MRRDLHTSIKKAARVLAAVPSPPPARKSTSLLQRRVRNSSSPSTRQSSLLLMRLGVDPQTAVSATTATTSGTRRQAAKTSIGGIPLSLSPSHKQAQLQRIRSSIQQRQLQQRQLQLQLQQQQQQQQQPQARRRSAAATARSAIPSKTERAAQNAMAIQQAIRISSPFYTQPDLHSQQQPSFWRNLLSVFSSSQRTQSEHRIQHHHYHHHYSSTDTSAFTNYPPVSSLIMEAETALPPTSTISTSTSPDPTEPITHINPLPPPFFEALPLILPPNYPPPTPRIPDMDLRAIALGVNHLAGSDIGRDAAWVLERPARLEYLGDSVLELATRSLLFRELTDLSPHSMGMLKAHLVSNDVLGHLYNQAGLESLRVDTAEWAIETLRTQHPSSIIGGKSLLAELDGGKHAITEHQDLKSQAAKRWLCFGTPEDKTAAFSPSSLYTTQGFPASSSKEEAADAKDATTKQTARRKRISQYLSDLPHSRKADLFEAYLGALYISLSPSLASEWVQALLRPFAARAMRHERMQSEDALTRAGLVRRRAKQKREAQLETERRVTVKEYEEQARREMAGSDLVEVEPAVPSSSSPSSPDLSSMTTLRESASQQQRPQHQPKWNINTSQSQQHQADAPSPPSPTWWQRIFRP